MELFIDSADVQEIREAASWGILSGVTTNPSLVAKEGRDFQQILREIAGIVDGPISAEVTATKSSEMLDEARFLANIHPNIVIKLPMTPEGLKATRALYQQRISTNVTLVFTTGQALLAARAGATYVSPFVGRLDDAGHDGIGTVREIADIFDYHGIETQIIAASMRHPRHVVEAARAGAHVATCPFKVLRQLFDHPLTEAGLARFLADWEAARKKRT